MTAPAPRRRYQPTIRPAGPRRRDPLATVVVWLAVITVAFLISQVLRWVLVRFTLLEIGTFLAVWALLALAVGSVLGRVMREGSRR